MKTHLLHMAIMTCLLGVFAGLYLPQSLKLQVAHAPTLFAVSRDTPLTAYLQDSGLGARLDAARFTKIIIETTGSGVAIKSGNNYTGFAATGLVGERLVLTKTDGGWKAAREHHASDLRQPLASLIEALVDHAGVSTNKIGC